MLTSILLIKFWWIWILGLLIVPVLIFIRQTKNTKRKRRTIITYVLFFIYCIIISFAIRMFVFEISFVRGKSMEQTLSENDVLLINKLSYGPSLPETKNELPFQNLIRKSNILNSYSREYRRLPGLSSIQRGDIVAFKDPKINFKKYIKRCIGLPGDLIEIRMDSIFVNGTYVPDELSVQHDYYIYAPLKNLRDIQHTYEEKYVHLNRMDSSRIRVSLTKKMYYDLLTDERIESIVKVKTISNSYNSNYEPSEINNNDHYKVLIPSKGMRVDLNHETFDAFNKIITRFEKNRVILKDGSFLDRTDTVQRFMFSQDYFFFIGDNRNHSIDSRTFGLIPEKYIIGKAILIYKCKNRE